MKWWWPMPCRRFRHLGRSMTTACFIVEDETVWAGQRASVDRFGLLSIEERA
jgi:hypothetical protein